MANCHYISPSCCRLELLLVPHGLGGVHGDILVMDGERFFEVRGYTPGRTGRQTLTPAPNDLGAFIRVVQDWLLIFSMHSFRFVPRNAGGDHEAAEELLPVPDVPKP